MKIYTQAGWKKTYANAAAVTSGQPIAIGERAGVAMADYEANEAGEYLQGGVVKLAKKAATAMAIGVSVGWDISAEEVVLAADENSDFDLGEVHAAAAANDAEIEVLINKQPYALI